MTSPNEYAAALQREQDTAKEYGRWVAKDAIFINGARAFNAGDAVPTSHVESGVVHPDQVVGAATKTAATLTEKV